MASWSRRRRQGGASEKRNKVKLRYSSARDAERLLSVHAPAISSVIVSVNAVVGGGVLSAVSPSPDRATAWIPGSEDESAESPSRALEDG